MATKQSSPYNSFLSGSSKLFPTEKYNYTDTSVDMVENVNKQIDESKADFKEHIQQVIDINNQYYTNQQNNLNKLIGLIPKAAQLAKFAQQKAEINATYAPFFAQDGEFKLAKDNAELTADEDASNIQYLETGAVTSQLEETSPTPENIEYLRAFSNSTKLSSSNKALATHFARQIPMFFEQMSKEEEIEFSSGRIGLISTAENYNERVEASYTLYRDLLQHAQNDLVLSERQLKKYVMPSILQAHNLSLNKYVSDQQALQSEDFRERRKDELFDSMEVNPGEGLASWIKKYHGYHKFSWATGRKEAFIMLGELVKDGKLKVEDIDKLKNDIIIGNDGQPHIIEEYWGDDPHFSELDKIVNNARKDVAQANELDRELKEAEFKDRELDKIYEDNLPPDEEYMENLQAQHIAAFGKRAGWIDDYLTKQDIKDEDIDKELSRRYLNSEILKPADLDGITDLEMRIKWKKRIQEGGMTKDQITNRDKWLDGQVTAYTEDETLDKARTNPLWIAVRQQATNIFNAKYRAERNAGQTHEVAYSQAMQETSKVIKGGTLDTFPILERDEKRANDLQQSALAISKDRNIIFSSQPLQGEEIALKEALTYYQTGRGNIPEYYRRIASFYKNITPYELLKHRLVTTGVLKDSDVEPLPERELPPEQQDLLLNKTSPARTLRSFASDDGEALNNLVAVSSYETPEQLTNVLRANAERNNQYSGWDISLVNIDSDLLEEHNQVVGEQSPFANLNTMLPGVATAYVEDTYNV